MFLEQQAPTIFRTGSQDHLLGCHGFRKRLASGKGTTHTVMQLLIVFSGWRDRHAIKPPRDDLLCFSLAHSPALRG